MCPNTLFVPTFQAVNPLDDAFGRGFMAVERPSVGLQAATGLGATGCAQRSACPIMALISPILEESIS